MPCRTRISILAAVIAMVCLPLAPSPAAAAIRCGTQIIGRGDSSLRLLRVCGKPAVGNPKILDYGEWVYNFGPNEFMVKVIITNGKVTQTQALGRGYVPKQGAQTEAPHR